MNQPEENRQKTPKTDQVLRPEGERDQADAERRDAAVKQVAKGAYGSDVRPGQESSETPRAGATEPPD